MNFVDETDYIVREMAASLVRDVLDLRQEIKHPALAHKLSPQELWQRWGQDYVAMREDEEMMGQTLEGLGQPEALEFSRQMESAMEKFYAP